MLSWWNNMICNQVETEFCHHCQFGTGFHWSTVRPIHNFVGLHFKWKGILLGYRGIGRAHSCATLGLWQNYVGLQLNWDKIVLGYSGIGTFVSYSKTVRDFCWATVRLIHHFVGLHWIRAEFCSATVELGQNFVVLLLDWNRLLSATVRLGFSSTVKLIQEWLNFKHCLAILGLSSKAGAVCWLRLNLGRECAQYIIGFRSKYLLR